MKAKYLGGLFLAPALMLANGAAQAEMNCTIELKRTEIGFIVSIGGGGGTLTCDGQAHKFRVGGLKFGAAGAAGSDAVGEVNGLNKLSDFNGTYSETKAQATVGKGQNVMDLANSNGVQLHLRGKSSGLDMQLAAGGLKITLE